MTVENLIIAFFTIAILSVAFKDNPVYRFAEHAYVGLLAGYTVLVNWFNYGQPTLEDIFTNGHYSYLIPVVLGLLMYARYIKPVSYMSRIPTAFVTGVGAGYVLTKTFKPDFMSQLIDTIRPLTGVPASEAINNALLALGVTTTLLYFLFTLQRKSVAKGGAVVGRLFMMVAFGAAFGNTVMTRYARLLGRLQFLLGDVLGLIK